MNSMPNPEQTDRHDVAVAAIKDAYEQIGRADKQLPRADEQVSRLEQDAASRPSEQQERLTVPGRRPSRDSPALRGLIGLLMAACIGGAAIALRSPGDAAKWMIATWAPPGQISSSSVENPLPSPPSPPGVQSSVAKAAPPEPAPSTPPAQANPEDVAQTSAIPAPSQPLQPLARDRAAVEQEIEQLKASIEQLKASQEQMVRDNAELAEQLKAAQLQMARDGENAAQQLKASQEQVARLIAKASDQNLQSKTSAPLPRSIASPTRKPTLKLSSPQAGAPRAHAPIHGRPKQQNLSSVPR